ncbi:MAG: hypothetical protein HZC29_01080 [Thaumarchaeota archaeon]|nr:hypothetical protein [Nitrososphaerota archaeon]
MSTEEKKQPEELKSYRGFDDEFKTYTVDDITLATPKLGFNDTEKLEQIAEEYNEQTYKFNKKEITGNELNKAKSKFIKESLKMMLSPQDYEIVLQRLSKPVLFGITKDLFAFLQVIGSKEELQHLLMQSKLITPMNSDTTET